MFDRILIATDARGPDEAAIGHALLQLRGEEAALACIAVLPDMPGALAPQREALESLLRERIANALATVARRIGTALPEVPVKVHWGERFATSVIRHVLREGIDLVVKATVRGRGDAGFDAMDMELLRKCPCAVWLARPCDRGPGEARIGVAIDPDPPGPEGLAVARTVLRTALHLARGHQETVPAVSAWDYPLERSLRGSGFLSVPEAEVAALVQAEAGRHRQAFEAVVRESGAQRFVLHHLRGAAGTVIPGAVAGLGIDILVMGTIGRTGLPGLLMGNTAENILHRLGCSLVAVKPPGFVSPVKLA